MQGWNKIFMTVNAFVPSGNCITTQTFCEDQVLLFNNKNNL